MLSEAEKTTWLIGRLTVPSIRYVGYSRNLADGLLTALIKRRHSWYMCPGYSSWRATNIRWVYFSTICQPASNIPAPKTSALYDYDRLMVCSSYKLNRPTDKFHRRVDLCKLVPLNAPRKCSTCLKVCIPNCSLKRRFAAIRSASYVQRLFRE